MHYKYLIVLVGILFVAVGVAMAENLPVMALLGGNNTIVDNSEKAFSEPIPLLSGQEQATFEQGDRQFERRWRPANGLGPIFNAVSCESCHRNDGRGQPPSFVGDTGTGFLIRLAINEHTATGATTPDPIYGGQFQDMAVRRTNPEGTVRVSYTQIRGQYADGTSYTLYAPNYDLVNLNYGALNPDTTFSPRMATQLIGLGYFEAIPESTILAMADPNDSNGDGISGRANYVWNVANNQISLGRFGWKANQPSLLQQNAAALNGDIGITTSLFTSQPCTDNEVNCLLNINLLNNP